MPMATPKIRSFAIYVGGKKTATAKTFSSNINPARTAMFASEGYLAHAHGAPMWSIEIGGPVPVSGSDGSALLEKVIRGDDIEVGFIYGGKFLRGVMACTKLGQTSDTESGRAEETYSLEGGPPKVAG